jgi:hypothetical protein
MPLPGLHGIGGPAQRQWGGGPYAYAPPVLGVASLGIRASGGRRKRLIVRVPPPSLGDCWRECPTEHPFNGHCGGEMRAILRGGNGGF